MLGEAQLRCAIALERGHGSVLGMKWYFVEKGQRIGPVEREILDERVRDGTVQADTLVWRPGLSDWRRATDVAELEVPPSLPGMPPPLPPAGPAADNQVEGELRAWAEARAAERNQFKATAEKSFGGFWARLAAKIIDGLLLLGIGMLLAEGVATIFYDGSIPVPPDWRGFFRAQGLMTLLNAGAAIWFSLYFIRRFEATPGKRMLGLRIVGADGSRVGAGRIILRYFGEQLSALLFLSGYVMAAFDDEKRTLHDYLCDTRVVKGERTQTAERE